MATTAKIPTMATIFLASIWTLPLVRVGLCSLNRHGYRADSQLMSRKAVASITSLLVITFPFLISPAVANPDGNSSVAPNSQNGETPKAFVVGAPVLNALDYWQESKLRSVKREVIAEERALQTSAMYAPTLFANGEAVRLQTELNDFARNTFIFGSPTTTQLILNGSDGEISDVIHGLKYVEAVSVDKGVKTSEALEESIEQQDSYAKSLGRSLISRSRFMASEWLIGSSRENVLALALAEGEDIYDAILPSASIDSTGCPTEVSARAINGLNSNIDVYAICQEAIAQAETPQAKAAISYAFSRLGSPYACEGVGRMNQFQFDCSSFVSRAYEEGAGVITSVDGWSATTHTMIPKTHPVFRPISPKDISAGDLALYYTCPEGEVCSYNHVVMYVGVIDGVPLQLHTNNCGGVANITPFWGAVDSDFGKFLGVREVVPSSSKWSPPVEVDAEGNIVTPQFG